jgi:hypothetical protein
MESLAARTVAPLRSSLKTVAEPLSPRSSDQSTSGEKGIHADQVAPSFEKRISCAQPRP